MVNISSSEDTERLTSEDEERLIKSPDTEAFFPTLITYHQQTSFIWTPSTKKPVLGNNPEYRYIYTGHHIIKTDSLNRSS